MVIANAGELAIVGVDKIEEAVAEFDRAMAMGLPSGNVKEFVRALIARGALLSAIAVRRKY